MGLEARHWGGVTTLDILDQNKRKEFFPVPSPHPVATLQKKLPQGGGLQIPIPETKIKG